MNRSRSHELFEKACALFPGGVNSPVRSFRSVGGEPFIVREGRGPYLFDLDGNRYVDYICSWGPLVLGHAAPPVVEALQKAIERGTSYGAPNEYEVELAQLIQQYYPAVQMMRFVSSGTEAVMHALRVARGFTGRQKIIKFEGCFHGASDPLLVKAGSGVATLGLPDSAGVPAQAAAMTLTARFNDLQGVSDLLDANQGEVAVIVLEPVVGNSGFIRPVPGFLEGLRSLATKHGALLLFDEVMTGWRVHIGGAQKVYGVTPDLVTMGKVIGGGLPVGLYGGRKEIMSAVAPLGPVYQAGTLSGNPLAMVAGIATIKEWVRSDTFERTTRITERLVSELRISAQKASIPIFADSIGTMFGFFFTDQPVTNFEDAKRSNVLRFKEFFHLMLEGGVYFAPSQFEAGFTSISHEGEALEFTISRIKDLMPLLTRE